MQELCKSFLCNLKKPLLVFFLIILSFIVLAKEYTQDYIDPITYSKGDLRWCKLYGVCTFDTITTENIITGNLSIIGQVFNVTMNLVTWNITESFNVGGNLEAKNITALDKFIGDGSLITGITASSVEDIWVNESLEIGNQTFQTSDEDVELRILSDSNKHSFLYLMESSLFGFRLWYDGSGTNTFKFDAIDNEVIRPQIWFNRDTADIDFFANTDWNDNNLSNVQCLELDNKEICSFDDVNISIGDINITEGIGEHWWNETDTESSDFTTTGDVSADNFIGNGSQLTDIQVEDIWVNIDGDTMTEGGDIRIQDSEGEYHNVSRVLQITDEMNRNVTLTGLNGSLGLDGNLTITTLTGENIVVNIDKNESILNRNVDSIIITSGTNESPILNHIVYVDASNPVLAKRTTISLKAPSVAAYLQGANFTYASAIGLATIDNLVGGLFNRFFRDGSTYRSGFDFNVSTNMVNISTGVISFLFDEVDIILNHSTSDLYVHVHSDGSFHQHTTLDDCDSYNEGSLVSNNKYFNAVLGIAITYDGNGVMYVVTQDPPSTEYTKAIDAEVDLEDTINYFPSDEIVSLAYIPIARVVIRRSGGVNTIQTLSNGLLFDDLRGTVTKTSSSPPPSGITNHDDLSNLGWSVAGHTIDTTVEFGNNKLNEANITNSTISAEDIDRDLPTNCPAGNYAYAFGDNFSTWFCRADLNVNNTGYVNIETINTSTTCINNSCIDDWSHVNISGNGGAYARSATLVVCASDSLDTTNCDYFCDGTADEEEINTAIGDLPATGGLIMLMDGTYDIDASITIDVSNTAIVGQGKNTRIYSNSGLTFITATSKDGLLFENLYFQCTGYGTGRPIHLTFSNGCKIKNCWFEDVDEAIYLSSSDNCIIEGNHFEQYVTYPVDADGGSDRMVFIGNIVDNVQGAMHIGAIECNIIGNLFINSDELVIYGDNNIITGNFFDASSWIEVRGEHTVIVGNTFTDKETEQALYLNSAHYCTVDGNTFEKLDKEAIKLSASNYNVISGNNIHDVSEDADNTYPAILLTSTSTYNIIEGNRISADATNKHSYGIQEAASADDYNVYRDNLITDAQTSEYLILGEHSNIISTNVSNGSIDFQGGYGDTGISMYQNGDMSIAGNLVIDGTCLSEGTDCNADIAELTHSKASADNTTCVIIPEHIYTFVENYTYINNETMEEEWYLKYHNTTIPRKVECSLNPDFNLEFESGDVVCIDKEDPQHIKFCEKSYDTSVLSVVNYDATLIINQRAPYPVSLSGNIPIKVICSTPIEIGDLLVSSNTKGYAQSFKTWQLTATWSDMKKVWEHTGSPFAKALENCNSGSKTIRAWI